MIYNIIPPILFKPTLIWYKKFSHIFLSFVLRFGVSIPNTLGETNGNVAWKLENVVTALKKNDK